MARQRETEGEKEQENYMQLELLQEYHNTVISFVSKLIVAGSMLCILNFNKKMLVSSQKDSKTNNKIP